MSLSEHRCEGRPNGTFIDEHGDLVKCPACAEDDVAEMVAKRGEAGALHNIASFPRFNVHALGWSAAAHRLGLR